MTILLFMIGLLSFSSYGLLEQTVSYNYIELERSLEYRNVLLRDMHLADEVERKFSQYTIVAPSVMAQILALPELGYVPQKRTVLIYGTPAKYEDLKNFEGMQRLKDIKKTLWIGLYDDMSDDISKHFPFPVDPRDLVLEKIFFGDKKASLIMGGYAIEKMWELETIASMKRHRMKNSEHPIPIGKHDI